MKLVGLAELFEVAGGADFLCPLEQGIAVLQHIDLVGALLINDQDILN